jgi:glyoxylase-like metal-dependent hydrolase (beta-lactamase superfamily II)
VLAHGADAPGVRKGGTNPPMLGMVRALARPYFARYLAHIVRTGGARTPAVAEVGTFADGERLDVPGRPRVIHVPGHTPGECALHLEDRDALFSGDALVTLDTGSGATGPRLLAPPFAGDREQARASLDRLAGIEAGTLLPGHGEPWTGGVAEAVRIARA